MWVTKLLISPVKKGFFAQKRPNLAQNWHFWSIWARPCRLIQCPVGGSVGGCGAGCISQDTYLLYYYYYYSHTVLRCSFSYYSHIVLQILIQVFFLLPAFLAEEEEDERCTNFRTQINRLLRNLNPDMIFIQNFKLTNLHAKNFTPQKCVICNDIIA